MTRLIMYDLKTDKSVFVGKKNEGVEGDNVIQRSTATAGGCC